MGMVAGWLVCTGLLIVGYFLGSPLTIALFASLAFGSTAVFQVGGSTLPAYIGMAMLLLAALALHKSTWRDLSSVFRSEPLAQLTMALTIYAICTALLYPRLFAGTTDVFIPLGERIAEMPLAPVPGNTNQSMYFLFNGAIFLAIAVLLKQGRTGEIRLAFMTWAFANAALGSIDVVAKSTGLGDILNPIRTAGYADLSSHAAGIFPRINGGFPEASSYAWAAASSLAFVFTDWQATKSRVSLALAFTLTTLLILSTSSTAYLVLAVGGAFAFVSIPSRLLQGHVFTYQIAMVVVALAGFTALLGLSLYDYRLMAPVVDMILSATVNKAGSDSAIERGMWNTQSLANFVDTFGIGVGLGSTRSSSWAISVLAQLGVVGAILFGILVACLFAGLYAKRSALGSLTASACAAALVGLVAASTSGGNADPGMIFFIAIAVVSTHLALPSVSEKAPTAEPSYAS